MLYLSVSSDFSSEPMKAVAGAGFGYGVASMRRHHGGLHAASAYVNMSVTNSWTCDGMRLRCLSLCAECGASILPSERVIGFARCVAVWGV